MFVLKLNTDPGLSVWKLGVTFEKITQNNVKFWDTSTNYKSAINLLGRMWKLIIIWFFFVFWTCIISTYIDSLDFDLR